MEYVVDCEVVPYPSDPTRALVLPVSVAGHVHERLVRCGECRHASRYTDGPVAGHCRRHHKALWGFDGFCSEGEPMGGVEDGRQGAGAA